MEEFQRWGRGRLAGLLVTLAALLLPASAGAADKIYWGAESAGTIRVANLDGSGTAATLFGSESAPCGVAIDPAAGKIYWANFGSDGIRVANLDGSGTASSLFPSEGSLCGVAIDPAHGKIYWANFASDTIRVGNLDGSGSPATLFTAGDGPSGVTIDPASGKIYWTNQFSDTVQVGNLDGTGTASDLFGPAGEDNPLGVVINPATGKIYWTDLGLGTVRVANLDGSGSPSTLFGGESQPGGLAIDPASGKIYWANFSGTIRVANLDGTGTAATLFGGESNPLLPALLRSPAGTGAPTISGGAGINQELTCSQGDWAPDLLEAFLYRAPQSFAYEWQNDGVGPILGTDPNFTPTEAGSYTCRVTATNQAGSNSQTSAPHTVSAPVAVDDTATVAEDSGATQIDVLANDTGGGPKTIDSVTQPANGSAVITGGGSGLTYQPSPDYCNTDPPAPTDDFTYSLNGGSSATVAVTVTCAATNPPSIDSVYPADGAIDVSRSGVTYAIFNRAMDKPTAEGAFSLKRSSDGAPVSGSFVWYGNALIFVPNAALAAGTQYTASISTAAKDLAGNPLAVAKSWQFTTTNPPSIDSVYPADGAIDVSRSGVTYAIFNRAMDKPTAEAAFSLKRSSDGAPVSGSFVWYGNALIFVPNAALAAGTQYTASISTAAKDLAGNPLAVAKTWQFTTTNPPSIDSVYPADGAIDVSRSGVTYAIFNRAMDKPTAEAAFSLKRSSDGAPVSGSFVWYGNALIFVPNAALAAGTQYTASVSTAAKDLGGNPLANPVTWSYTTGASG